LEGLLDDRLRLLQDSGQVVSALEALGVELVDVLGSRGAGGKPAVGVTTFRPPMGAPFPGAVVSRLVIFSPASSEEVSWRGESSDRIAFCSGVAGASMRW